jgi:hypothetical protein
MHHTESPRQPYPIGPEQPEDQPGFPEQPGPTGPEVPEEQPGVPEIPQQ